MSICQVHITLGKKTLPGPDQRYENVIKVSHSILFASRNLQSESKQPSEIVFLS
jgi:hypothetical protein